MAPQRPKKKQVVQRSLEQSGQFPLLKKPAECVGRNIGVLGEHWGSACAPADKTKTFLCTVMDYTLVHVHSPTERWPAMKLVEMGTDGTGGNSEAFWMRYPFPFLTFWYKTYPMLASPATTAEAEPVTEEVGGLDTTEATVLNSKVYNFLAPLRSEKRKGRQVNMFTCKVLKVVQTVSGPTTAECGAPCTLFGKSSGPFFKHVRRLAKTGCEGHKAAMEELNLSSSRQVRGPGGKWTSVFTFEECFPHHIRFVWMVATGMPSRYSRRPAMREYIRGFESRAVMPHHNTIHRIAEAIDEVQRAQQRGARRSFIRKHKGRACVGGQLDLWTDKNSGIVYAATHITHVTENEQANGIHQVDELLDFYMFPFISHVSVNIRDWFLSLMDAEELPASVWVGITPDGAGLFMNTLNTS